MNEGQIGWLVGAKRVECDECNAAAPGRRAGAPLYRVNVYPYRQRCHACGKTLVEGQSSSWPELFTVEVTDAQRLEEAATFGQLREFWRMFTNKFYDAGFGDVVVESQAIKAKTRGEMMVACSFIAGAAYVARLANPFLSRQWKLCHAVGTAAGVCVGKLDGYVDATLPQVITTWTNEVAAELAKPANVAEVSVGGAS